MNNYLNTILIFILNLFSIIENDLMLKKRKESKLLWKEQKCTIFKSTI